LGRFLLFTVTVIITWCFFAFILPYVPCGYTHYNKNKQFRIFVESNGVHTDFVLPVRNQCIDWSKYFPFGNFEVADNSFNYISVGWGDKGFYLDTPTWSDLTFSTAFKAAFGLGTSAMHVTYRRNKPVISDNCVELELSEYQYNILTMYIRNTFKRNGTSFIPIAHKGYSSHDCFYEANGTYSLFKTCNVWTGNGLRACGLPAGSWTPLSSGVIDNISE